MYMYLLKIRVFIEFKLEDALFKKYPPREPHRVIEINIKIVFKLKPYFPFQVE